MKRFCNLLRQLARRGGRRSGTATWMYRDYVCTITRDAETGQLLGGIAGIEDGPMVSGETVDELRMAVHQAIDALLDVGKP